MEEQFNTAKVCMKKYVTGADGKTKAPIWRILVLGVLAGFYIAIGASSSSTAMHSIADVGVARLVAGCIFPVGLMLIVITGGELFTGNCMMVMGVMDHKFSVLQLIKVLVLVYFSNMVGSILMAYFIVNCGQLNFTGGALGAFTIKVAYGKCNLSFMTAVISGILCNVLVCLAVIMALAAKDIAGKIFAMFFPIMAFVVGGYEHCVANMYYIPAGILAKNAGNYADKAMELYGYTADQIASVNWYNFFITNLIPVTIGNIIGGMIFVGLPLYILNKDN